MRLKLKEYRVKNKYTQEGIAKEIGIPRSTYCQYEIGGRMPSVYLVYRIAKLFCCSMEDLIATENDGERE